MKKLTLALAVIGLLGGNVLPTFAKSENSAEGKAVGQQPRGEEEKGASGNAPGRTDPKGTGKKNAPGQNKGEPDPD